jgi:hypothetical protein
MSWEHLRRDARIFLVKRDAGPNLSHRNDLWLRDRASPAGLLAISCQPPGRSRVDLRPAGLFTGNLWYDVLMVK